MTAASSLLYFPSSLKGAGAGGPLMPNVVLRAGEVGTISESYNGDSLL